MSESERDKENELDGIRSLIRGAYWGILFMLILTVIMLFFQIIELI